MTLIDQLILARLEISSIGNRHAVAFEHLIDAGAGGAAALRANIVSPHVCVVKLQLQVCFLL